MQWWRACRAMTGLTVREIIRQKSWLILIAAIAVMLIALANLDAVDDAARLKLSIATISGSINFVSTLFAILLVAAIITRDRDQLLSLTLFPKPLPMSAYVCGRWLGVQVALALGIISLNVIGSAVVYLQADQPVPPMRNLHQADGWQRINSFGETATLDAERCSVPQHLGVRWRFSGLPTGADLSLLLKGRVKSIDPAHVQARVKVTLQRGPDAPQQLLELEPRAPYGAILPDGRPVSAGEAMMKDKTQNYRDLNQDYLRFRVPAEAIAADGSCLVAVTNMDGNVGLLFHRERSCLVARNGGSFFINMQRASCIVLAQVAYLNAIALLCACVSSIGVTLLTGLTAFFGALLLSYIQEMAPVNKVPNFLMRFLDIASVLIPDFNRFGVEAALAGGHAINWSSILDASLYYGTYCVVLLVLAWLVMLRREL